jgi:hypothetical protein
MLFNFKDLKTIAWVSTVKLQPTHKYMNKSKSLKIQTIENQLQLVRIYVGLGAFMNKLKFKIIK